MKNKKVIYLLLVCVAAVWGIIFYRMMVGLSAEEKPPVPEEITQKGDYFNLTDHSKDVFKPESGYRNPFSTRQLVEVDPGERVHATPIKGLNPLASVAKAAVNWSGIVYSGYIINPASKKKVAILAVNGKESMLSEGESSNGIKLIQYAGDSVKVSYQNESKYIKIK